MEFDRDTLSRDVLSIIKKDGYQISDLRLLLLTSNTDLNNVGFKSKLDDVIQILLVDRNGDEKVDIRDLELLSKDPMAMMSLVYSIVLLIGSARNTDFSNTNYFEEYFTKLILYIFLVVIPSESKVNWDKKTKENIVTYTMSITHYIVTSKILNVAVKTIKKLYDAAKNKCNCTQATIDKDDVYENNKDVYHSTLRLNMMKIKEST